MTQAAGLSVAVTGGSGQLGTLVLERLAAAPEVARILCIDVRPPMAASDKIHEVERDIRDPALAADLAGCDALVHCAFLVSSHERPDLFRSVNVDGSSNVFACAAAAGVRTVVYLSSITAYGCVPGHAIPLTETSPRLHQEDFPYASCKFQVEALLDAFEPRHPEIAISRIRANVLIGRRIPHMLGLVLRIGWVPDLDGAPFPIVWDEDVADLILLALRHRAHGAFIAAADELLPAEPLAAALGLVPVRPSWLLLLLYRVTAALLRPVGLNVVSDPAWATQTRGAALVGSSARAKCELGWRPTCPTAVDVMRRFHEIAPRMVDLRIAVLVRTLPRLCGPFFGPASDPFEARLHLQLLGPRGGDYGLLLQKGHLKAHGGAPIRPTSRLSLDASLFLALAAGEAEPDQTRAAGAIQLFGAADDWRVFRHFACSLRDAAAGAGSRGVIARLLTLWARP